MVPSQTSFKLNRFIRAVLCLLAIGLGREAVAQERAPTTRIGLGGGIIASTTPIKGAEGADDLLIVPWIIYDSPRFYFRGVEGGIKLLEDAPVQLTLSARAAFGFSWEADDSSYLVGMDDRDVTLELGVSLSKSFGRWLVSVAAWQDVLGKHDSQEVEISVGYRQRISPHVTLSPYAKLSYLAAGKANYYFGVRTEEALPGRPEYKPGATTIPTVGLRATYDINEQWSILANLALEIFSGEVRNSPIVDKDFEVGALLGVMRWF